MRMRCGTRSISSVAVFRNFFYISFLCLQRQGVLELAAELADVKRDGAGVSTDNGRMTWL